MRTALVLGAGGSRGAFEVGAVSFLYDQGIQPDILCGASVGSLNAAKLAEGEGSDDQGLSGLRAIWMKLMNNSDMYVNQEWVERLDANVRGFVTGDSDPSSMRGPPWLVAVLGLTDFFTDEVVGKVVR